MMTAGRRLLGARRMRAILSLAVGLAAVAGVGPIGSPPTVVHAAAATPSGAVGMARSATGGYWIATSYGDVVAIGGAPALGHVGALNAPVVGITATPSGNGYWLVASDGGVFPFGDAQGYGSLGSVRLNQPVVGMAAAPAGGYWLVAGDGGVFPFGPGAAGYGSTGNVRLNQPVVGMAAAASGRGYWLVASDGGVFPFGPGATGYGSTGNIRLNQPIVGMAAAPQDRGYWLVARDGGIFPFGAAGGYGSTGHVGLLSPIAGMAVPAGGAGYWLLEADGGIWPFGTAVGLGSAAGMVRYNSGDVVSRPQCGAPASAVTPGKVIVISLTCQQLSAYQNGMPVYDTVITTGRPALPTPPGQYSVMSKRSPFEMISDWPRSSPYWYPPSWVQYTLWFRAGGYAIHDAPWRSVYGPGTQINGSHGCVNVPLSTMTGLYGWADVGIPVRVY